MTGPTTSGSYPIPMATVCAPGPRTGSLFPRHYTVKAALVALHRWIETGHPAPRPRRSSSESDPNPTDASQKLSRDADGNAIGGLRSPIVAVPVAAYDGEACIQAGTTVPTADGASRRALPDARDLRHPTPHCDRPSGRRRLPPVRRCRADHAGRLRLDRRWRRRLLGCASVRRAVMTLTPPPLRRRSSRFTLS